MYSVFVRDKAGSKEPALRYGRPAYGDACCPEDIRWLATRDHDHAMFTKRTLERLGDFIRTRHHSLYPELAMWARQDARDLNIPEADAAQVAKYVWDQWCQSRANMAAHRAESFTDQQRLKLGEAYINGRAAAFLLRGNPKNDRDVDRMITPIGMMYHGGNSSHVQDLQRSLRPDQIRVERIGPHDAKVEEPHYADDVRLVMLRPHRMEN